MVIEDLQRLQPAKPDVAGSAFAAATPEPRAAAGRLGAHGDRPRSGHGGQNRQCLGGGGRRSGGGAQEHAWKVVELRGGSHPGRVLPPAAPAGAGIALLGVCERCPEFTPEQQAILRAEVVASQASCFVDLRLGCAGRAARRPVVWDRGLLVLAGATIGLVVGVWISATAPRRSRPHDEPGDRSWTTAPSLGRRVATAPNWGERLAWWFGLHCWSRSRSPVTPGC